LLIPLDPVNGTVPIELRQLRYFVAVVEEGQMTRAAQRLHLAQPALSQAISQLESQVGVKLLDRHPRGVALTRAGEAFCEKARQALRAAEEVDTAANAWSRAEAGELSVGFLPTTLVVAGALLDDFRRRRADIHLTTRELNFATQLSELRAGRLDAEIVSPLPDASDLNTERIFASARVVLMSPQHRLASRGALTFADIAEETQPGRHPEVPQEWADYNWLTAERGRRPPVTDETPLTPEECIPLLARGNVITISPEFVGRTLLVHGVIAVPLTDVAPFTVGIACRKGDDRHTVTALMALAREHYARAAAAETAEHEKP
jgi:DNA-binding transcriptional LysR family regulator